VDENQRLARARDGGLAVAERGLQLVQLRRSVGPREQQHLVGLSQAAARPFRIVVVGDEQHELVPELEVVEPKRQLLVVLALGRCRLRDAGAEQLVDVAARLDGRHSPAIE
jgi:hypothetical protein